MAAVNFFGNPSPTKSITANNKININKSIYKGFFLVDFSFDKYQYKEIDNYLK